ncbi:hypothetical protein JCM10213_002285 [Rhodosporidiobolus nylandii]
MPTPRLTAPLLALVASSSRSARPHIPQGAARALSSTAPSHSHVGTAPIPLPSAVTFVPPPSSSPAAPSRALVKGPKGELQVDIAPFVRLAVATSPATLAAGGASEPPSSHLTVAVADSSLKHQRAVWGLTRSLLANAVVGVSEGYSLPLRLVGVGYRAAVEDGPAASSPGASSSPQRLNLKLGFAHPVYVDLPADVKATTPTPTSIVLHGIDKQRLGEVAARIRSWRIPEPYNGKGIFVGDEQVRRKEVKKK